MRIIPDHSADGSHDRYPRRRRPHRKAVRAVQKRVKQKAEQRRVVREWKAEHRTFTPEEAAAEAERRWAAALRREHPHLEREMLRTIPSSFAVPRVGISELVEVRAIRNLAFVAELERSMRTGRGFGRTWERSSAPKGDRRLPLAALEAGAWMHGAPNMLSTYHAFREHRPLLHWAFDDPRDGKVSTYWGMLRGLHALCERTDDEVILIANVGAVRELARLKDDRMVGGWVAVDGMWIPAAREQRPAGSPEEDALLNHGPDISWGTHEDGHCRGWSLVVLTDLRTTLPLVWSLRPAAQREFTGVMALLQTLFRLWPDVPLTYLIGDSEYDQAEDLALNLERCYGVHPVFAERGTPGATHRWHENHGTPHCSRHGLMKLEQSDGFDYGPKGRAKRRKRGVADGEPVDMSGALHRWFCPECAASIGKHLVYTYFVDNPRLYAWLPRKGDHRRVGRRHALMHRRNAAESTNAALQAWGLGLPGKAGPFWCNQVHDMPWFAGMALAGMSFRRLVHANGGYSAALADAEARGHLNPRPPSSGTGPVAC